MDEKHIRRIAQGEASDFDLTKFDQITSNGMMRDPKENFTERVMSALPGENGRIGIHIWGILLGVALVIVMWGFNEFSTPEINIPYEAYNISGALQLTELTKVFMVANGLLLLLLIDRIIQRRNRMA